MVDPALLIRKIRTTLGACTLGEWPTPLESAPLLASANGVSRLWVKREDCSSPVYGGNKVRGLEFLLAHSTPATVFLTIGGTGSSHCLSTAVHARRLSRHTVMAQFPQPETEAASLVAREVRRVADRVIVSPDRWRFPIALARAWSAARRLGATRWIAGGGAAPLGVAGHIIAGLELSGAIDEPPDAVVTPYGSGGTVAGLLLAVAALGWSTHVVGVRVTPLLVANRLRVGRLVRGTRRLLEHHGIACPPVDWTRLITVDGQGAGYGHPSAAGEAARKLAAEYGLKLESTYGAKAFAAIAGLGSRGFGRVVFWHTFAFPPARMELNG
ncbi:MAG TPA: pyridoxal-phosphate dependent enzyme [Gemmatimonadales bacterium]|nr:pyridoxal-phosphate dependent enzyme [Gemmatimonadales bacterium]